MSTRSVIVAAMLAIMLLHGPRMAHAWGERGHRIVGLVADAYLAPDVRRRVVDILAGDDSGLTASTGMVDETLWADRFRDADRETTQTQYRQTGEWHFVDIELDHPDLASACFGHPASPPGVPASRGPAHDCIVDKIIEFRAELRSRATPPDERRRALQFLLHFIGDVHQPLHAADDHDRGGNDVRVQTANHASGNLHFYWDTVFVEELGSDAAATAAQLLNNLPHPLSRDFRSRSPAAWARQSYAVARAHTYAGSLAPARGARRSVSSPITLDAGYEADARRVVSLQLQRAGLRLAWLLNDALGTQRPRRTASLSPRSDRPTR